MLRATFCIALYGWFLALAFSLAGCASTPDRCSNTPDPYMCECSK